MRGQGIKPFSDILRWADSFSMTPTSFRFVAGELQNFQVGRRENCDRVLGLERTLHKTRGRNPHMVQVAVFDIHVIEDQREVPNRLRGFLILVRLRPQLQGFPTLDQGPPPERAWKCLWRKR